VYQVIVVAKLIDANKYQLMPTLQLPNYRYNPAWKTRLHLVFNELRFSRTGNTNLNNVGQRFYQKTILENNLRVVTEKIPGARSISLGFLVEAGSVDDEEDKGGLAHLTEHMLFQGTGSRSAAEIALQMDLGGGLVGGFTARDYTCFTATVLDDYYTYTLDLFSDLLLNSTFPAENLRREKEAILNEIATSYDNPQNRTYDLLVEQVWHNQPLGKSITGLPASVKKLTREDLIYFVHTRYLPNRIIVAAAGNVEHADFVAQVRDGFWRMLGDGLPRSAITHSFNSGVIVDHRPVSQVYFSIGIQALPYAHPERYCQYMLNGILGSGISSRLYRRLREERGLVYDIGSEYFPYRDDGLFVIEGSTTPEYLMAVLSIALNEIRKLATGEEPVSEEELWKTRMKVRGQHLIAAESSSTILSRLVTQELYFKSYISTGQVLADIERVEVNTINDFCLNKLKPALKRAAIAITGSEMPKHYSTAAVNELLESVGDTNEFAK
jgi:predicted Zn-dependent peptidase